MHTWGALLAGAAVLVVVVTLMQVLTEGMMTGTGRGMGMGRVGCGLVMGPQACFTLENSGSHAVMALRRARLG